MAILPDGRRLHLQHGPIDIVAEAFGEAAEVSTAYRQAGACFATILDDLVAELDLLRRPLGESRPALRGPVARRMLGACWPHRAQFVTPMAAVAGSVADEVLAAMHGRVPSLSRAYVNNGGDIAVHLSPGTSVAAGVVNDPDRPGLDDRIVLNADRPARGMATSGWRGRSLSFGIADAVTVLAKSAAGADAAATLDRQCGDRRPSRHRARAGHLAPRGERPWRAPGHGRGGAAARAREGRGARRRARGSADDATGGPHRVLPVSRSRARAARSRRWKPAAQPAPPSPHERSMSGAIVGVDVGGTFTDLILMEPETGAVRLAKVPSTPANQAAGVLAALDGAAASLGDVAAIIHGTTVTTNALLERKLSRCGLITTKGFRDILELGRRTRPNAYGLTGSFTPLIPRELRIEVPERMDADGDVLVPLDEAAVHEAVSSPAAPQAAIRS